MKKFRTTISRIEDMEALTNRLAVLLEKLDAIEISVSEPSTGKTQAQSNLYHMWMREIGDELGYDVDEMKHICKEKFMLNIYVDDKISNYHNISETMQAARKKLSAIEFNDIREGMIASMSHLDLDVKQMRVYLRNIQRWAGADLNIRLTDPGMKGLI